MIEETSPLDIDIIAIQEPNIDHLGLSRAGNGWRAVYPNRNRIRWADTQSLLLVSNMVSLSAWSQISVDLSDVTAVLINMEDCDVMIWNIYINCNHSLALNMLQNSMNQVREGCQHRTQFVVLGDFNRHHPMWDNEKDTQLFTRAYLDQVQELIDLMGNQDMEMALLKGVLTLEHMQTK